MYVFFYFSFLVKYDLRAKQADHILPKLLPPHGKLSGPYLKFS